MGKIIRLGDIVRRVVPKIDWRSFGERNPSSRRADKLLRDSGFGVELGARGVRSLYRAELVRVSDGKVMDYRTGANMVPREGCQNLLAIAFAAQAVPSWFVGYIKQQVSTTGAITASSTSLTLGASATTLTGQQVTIFGAGTSGANLVTTITTGATSTAQTVANAAVTTVAAGSVVVLGPTFATTDTRATHTGWTAIASTDVTNANWLALTLPAPFTGSWATAVDLVAVDNSASTANYTPNTNHYACGAFLVTSNLFALSAGYLFGEAGFTQGALGVQGGNAFSLNITVTLQAQAA